MRPVLLLSVLMVLAAVVVAGAQGQITATGAGGGGMVGPPYMCDDHLRFNIACNSQYLGVGLI